MELEETQLRLAKQGRELRFVSPDIFHMQHPDHHLERLVSSNPSAAWILWIVSEQIQRWFEKQGVPAFLMGSPFPEVNLPFIVNTGNLPRFMQVSTNTMRSSRRRHFRV